MRPMTVITKAIPPTSSYWVGCDRTELRARTDARRPQMEGGWTQHSVPWDNGVASEISLRTRLAEQRIRAARRRAEVRR